MNKVIEYVIGLHNLRWVAQGALAAQWFVCPPMRFFMLPLAVAKLRK